jgi:outer membrane autotransporter protein
MFTDTHPFWFRSCREFFSDRVFAQSIPVHSVHVLAAVLAVGVLSAGMAQASDIKGTVDVPPNLNFNGTLNIGNGGSDGTLNIDTGGNVTVGGNAVLGRSPNATGTVNVTGPNATFITGGNITVGFNGPGILTVNNGLVQSQGSIFLGSAQGSNKETAIITAVNGATIESQTNGITAEPTATVGTVIIDHSTLIAHTGDAFRVQDGASATISINNVNDTIQPSPGGYLLHVVGGSTASLAASIRTTVPGASALTGSILTGDILADTRSSANVFLEHHSTLNGAVNQNQLTGATGINPNESPTGLTHTVNLGIDSTSTWNIKASSTLNNLDVNPQAHINFADPPSAAPFKTLVMNNLIGIGGIFGMNVDLGLIKGDFINILTKSEGEHLLTFVNRNQGSDLPAHTALLVVRTPDGGAGFVGEADGGTFRYFVVHGDGSSVTPARNDWYLVRGDEITPREITPPGNPDPTPPPLGGGPTPAPTPPGGGPTPPPPRGGPTPAPTPPGGGPTPAEFTPGDDLPLPPELQPRPLSPITDLTPTANAAIGTFAATMPLFYADMDTLIERMGELRLLAQVPPPTPPMGISKEGGKEAVAPPPPVTPPAGGGVWFRGFGSGSHIDDQVSRSFHQNLGGFQVGADKRLVTRYGDLYLGGFAGYFYAHRDFQNEPFNQDATGTTNAFSVGAYGTLIHPSGFYADLVAKYTQLWNDFDAPNVLSSLGLGPSSTANYSIPTFGASLEIGKRWDFGHFFVEPQGQIEGAWAGAADYTVSNGLRVSADSQTSLRGRLGVRTGYHFDWGSKAFEPYAKVSVINEFLGGDRITTDQTSFFPTLSGVGIQAAAGVTARLTDSIYLYGEYDYANSDKIRIPWAVDAGIRWEW